MIAGIYEDRWVERPLEGHFPVVYRHESGEGVSCMDADGNRSRRRDGATINQSTPRIAS
jgi:hypothetical protein